MNILQLHTGLFPDGDTVAAALACLQQDQAVARIDISRPGMEEADWDGVVAALLAADLIITT